MTQAMDQFFKTSGITERLRHLELYPAWEAAVGEDLAELTKIRSFERNILRVWVDSAPLLSELSSFRKAEILAELNARLESTKVIDIKFYLS